jgi:hypothetical protein
MGKGSYFEDAERELRTNNTVTRDGDGLAVRYEDGHGNHCP